MSELSQLNKRSQHVMGMRRSTDAETFMVHRDYTTLVPAINKTALTLADACLHPDDPNTPAIRDGLLRIAKTMAMVWSAHKEFPERITLFQELIQLMEKDANLQKAWLLVSTYHTLAIMALPMLIRQLNTGLPDRYSPLMDTHELLNTICMELPADLRRQVVSHMTSAGLLSMNADLTPLRRQCVSLDSMVRQLEQEVNEKEKAG